MQFITHSPEETELLGQRLGETLSGGEIIAYQGGLGAGKTRSEERRVGKECRSRWSPYH